MVGAPIFDPRINSDIAFVVVKDEASTDPEALEISETDLPFP